MVERLQLTGKRWLMVAGAVSTAAAIAIQVPCTCQSKPAGFTCLILTFPGDDFSVQFVSR